MAELPFRKDIQALRGIAVLFVIFYHAGASLFPYGYLGVDVFFVLSGFLITSIICKDIDDHRFSLTSFYLKRAVRLLPAAYTVFALTILSSRMILTAPEYAAAERTFASSIIYVSNFQLWRTSDYFSPDTNLNPFLHTWSLSVEEQFYIFFPLILLLLRRRPRIIAFLALAVPASFALCLVVAHYRPVPAFYLLPTRAWELGLGGLLSQIDLKKIDRVFQRRNLIGFVALALLVSVAAFGPETLFGLPHPGLDALLVCAGTMLLLAVQPAFLQVGVASNVLRWIGDISYSLYLVHWPVLVLLKASYFNLLPPWYWRVFGILGAFALSAALYYWVEKPARDYGRMHPGKAVVSFLAVSALMFGGSMADASIFRRSAERYANARAANVGLSSKCEQYGNDGYVRFPDCRTSDNPKTIIWGDSYAMHLVPWFAATDHEGFEQATMSSCSPFLGVSLIHPDRSADWPRECMRFNREVFEYTIRSPSIRTVIMSSQLAYLLGASGDRLTWVDDVRDRHVSTAMAETIDGLTRAGKRVIFVSPTPSTGDDIALCHERQERHLLSWGADRYSCAIERAAVNNSEGYLFDFLTKTLPKDVIYIDLRDMLCKDKFCKDNIGGTPLYRDTGHLSIADLELLLAC